MNNEQPKSIKKVIIPIAVVLALLVVIAVIMLFILNSRLLTDSDYIIRLDPKDSGESTFIRVKDGSTSDVTDRMNKYLEENPNIAKLKIRDDSEKNYWFVELEYRLEGLDWWEDGVTYNGMKNYGKHWLETKFGSNYRIYYNKYNQSSRSMTEDEIKMIENLVYDMCDPTKDKQVWDGPDGNIGYLTLIIINIDDKYLAIRDNKSIYDIDFGDRTSYNKVYTRDDNNTFGYIYCLK